MNIPYNEFLLQWNTRSVISHWEQFKGYMLKNKPLIAAIQETRFLDSDTYHYNFQIKGYSLYTNNINISPRRGGSALYVSNNLLHHEIKINIELNAVAVKVHLMQREIVIVSIYIPPSPVVSYEVLSQFLGKVTSPCMVLGDFNAHHRSWGCAANDSRGNSIDGLLSHFDLVCISDQTPTHSVVNFNTNTISHSVIDLSIVSACIAPYFSSQVQSDFYFSDHYPIHILLETYSGQTDYNFLPRWNMRRADWFAFNDIINQAHAPESLPSLDNFLNTVKDSAYQTIPRTRRAPERKNAPWWNIACQRAVALRRRAERAFRRCICTEHEVAARRARSEAKETIKKAKQDSWAEYANQFNRFTPLSKIWSLIKSFTNKRTPIYKIPHLCIEHVNYCTPTEVTNAFAEHYARVSASAQYSAETLSFINNALRSCDFASDNTETYNVPFTEYELQLALSKCGNTSVGPDELAYPFLKNLTEVGRANLLHGFNDIWEHGTFPESWSVSTLIPILKQRKPPSEPASYRPISLTSCVSKLFGRIVNNRLRVYLESEKVLSPYQQGFRPSRCSADSIISLLDGIQRGFQKRQVTVALFLDLKSAFDKVHKTALLVKVHKIGLRGKITTFISNFLSNRSFAVRCGNTYSGYVEQQQGLPQGAVLSPTLFLIMINDIFDGRYNISQQLQFSMYADDLAIWFTDANAERANNIVQLALNHVQKWCDRWGLDISPLKSATVIFSKKRRNVATAPLRVNGSNIPLLPSFKYLGITLDNRLTFNEHILDLRQRSSRRLNIIKCIAGRDWGADRRTLLNLYISLIRSSLDYCAFLYDTLSTKQTSSLESIQNNALRIITGALRTSPVENIRAETNIPSLAHRRKLQLLRYFTRITAQPGHPSRSILHNRPRYRLLTPEQDRYPTISIRVQRALALFNIDSLAVMPVFPLRPFWKDDNICIEYLLPTKKHITPIEIVTRFNEFVSSHSDAKIYFTDGSRKEGKTGAAFTTSGFFMYFRLSDYHSIFSAELQAINFSLKRIQTQNEKQVVICTDCLSAVQAIAAFHSTSNPIVGEIRHTLSILPTDTSVTLLWIPGHSGIPGNEKADLLAKQSLTLPPQNHLSCPVTDIYNLLHVSFKNVLQREWHLTSHQHLIQIKPILGHWLSCNQNTRLKEIILARLRIGHTKITHSYIFEKEEPTLCHRCNIRYNVAHMLLYCPVYERQRTKLKNYVSSKRMEFNLVTLLGDSHPKLLDLLFEFLHETQLDQFI